MLLLLAVILAASMLSEGPTLLEALLLLGAPTLLGALMLSGAPMLLEGPTLLGALMLSEAPLCRPRNLRPPTLADAPLDLPSLTR